MAIMMFYIGKGCANCQCPLTCSDGVWDPEKWHASLYPASGRSSPVESVKKELDTDRPSLVRRIVGEHADTRKRGQQFWRQCCLLLASFVAVRALYNEVLKVPLPGNDF